MRVYELVRLALRSIRRTPLRVALTSLGVAVATGALVSMLAFASGLQLSAQKPFDELDLFQQIEVTPRRTRPARPGPVAAPPPSGARDAAAARKEEDGPILDDRAVSVLKGLPGVGLAYPRILLPGIVLELGSTRLNVFATGLPADAGRARWLRDRMVAGRFFETDAGSTLVLDKSVSKELGFASPSDAIGKEVTVLARGLVGTSSGSFEFSERRAAFRIAGVLEMPGWMGLSRFGAAIVPLDTIRALPSSDFGGALDAMRRGVSPRPGEHSTVVVRAQRLTDVSVVEKRIRDLGYDTEALVGRLDEMKKFFVLLDVLLGAVGTVALVVAGLGIVNTLLMAVLERYREIGAYKAIGASDADIRVLFLAEAGLVGLIGGIAGLGLGRLVSALIGLGVNVYARSKGVEEPIAVFAFPAWLVVGSVLFAILASVLSGVYPASRAARVDPILALRGE